MRVVRVCVCVDDRECMCECACARQSLSLSLSRLRLRVCMCCEHFDRMFAECLNVNQYQYNLLRKRKAG